jgi:hypothetical protein
MAVVIFATKYASVFLSSRRQEGSAPLDAEGVWPLQGPGAGNILPHVLLNQFEI